MSDNEASDDMEVLQEILKEYADAESDQKSGSKKEESVEKHSSSSPVDEPKEWIRSEEEIRLEKLLFGDKAGLLENLKKTSGSSKASDDNKSKAQKRKPAWHDGDDDELKLGEVKRETKYTGSLDHLPKDKSYKDYLKNRFQRIRAEPKWANLDREEELDSDEEVLRTVGFIDSSKLKTLPATNIEFRKLKDLNRATYAEGPVSSIQFHPTSTVAMVSGLNCIATLYSIDGLKNEKLYSIRFNDFPIKCAKILPCGTKALFSSHYRYYYSYDLLEATETRHVLPRRINHISNFEVSPCAKYFAANGRFGEVHLFDQQAKELIHTFKQEETCQAIRFSLDSSKLICSSKGATVNIFDIKKQRLMHSFIDDGCIKGQSLALSPNGKILATGSMEGAVNIYDYEKVFESKSPKPEKTILNLTTSITQLRFNHTSEILAMCSDMVPAAVKLVHFPSGTVFANFPGFNTNLRNVRTVEFSPASGFLAMGTKVREAPLFRLKHFNNY